MQKNKSNSIKLGVFVTVGVLLFIIGIYFVGKKQQLFNDTFTISGIFSDISGLQVGNNVRFSSITVGVIESIEMITDTSIKIDFSIDEKTRKFIKKDARAIIGSDGLMGNKIINILHGTDSSVLIENKDFIQTSIPPSMNDIMVNLKKTSISAAEITENLSAITFNIKNGEGTMGKFFMDNSFANNIDKTIKNAAEITKDLSAVMANVRSGKGSVGKLFMDETIANNMDSAINNLKQGTGGLKDNMEAASHNFLLRGYFNKKEKAKKKLEAAEKKKAAAEEKKKAKDLKG
jgi:phospholipid/cholesterol/gamma-HCH transport system substrate-binding protein